MRYRGDFCRMREDGWTKMAQASAKASKTGVWQRFLRYLNDVRAEFRRVVWPTRQDALNSTWIVVGTLFIFIVLVFVLDYASSALTTALARVGG
jgi:preprotein translocase SecE subunit